MSKKPTVPPTIPSIKELLAPGSPIAIAAWARYKDLKKAEYEAKKAEYDAKHDETKPAPSIDDFGIEDARVRRLFDKHGLNKPITSFIDALPTHQEKQADDTMKDVLSEADEKRKEAIQRERIRIGNAVSPYLASFCEEIVNDLVHAAIQAALYHEDKNIVVAHLFSDSGAFIQDAPFKNLFMSLPSFIAAQRKCEKLQMMMRAAKCTNSHLKRLTRFVKPAGKTALDEMREKITEFTDEIEGKKDKPAPKKRTPRAPAAAAVATADSVAEVKKEEAEPADDDFGEVVVAKPVKKPKKVAVAAAGTSADAEKKDARFTFYIYKILRVIRGSDKKFEEVRFSKSFVPLIDDILFEFVQLVAMRSYIHILTTGAETISEHIIRAVILAMMATPAALCEHKLAEPEMRHVESVSMKKITKEGGIVEKVKQTEEKDILVSEVKLPAFIVAIDTLYPLDEARPKKETAATAASATATTAAAPAAAKVAEPKKVAEPATVPKPAGEIKKVVKSKKALPVAPKP